MSHRTLRDISKFLAGLVLGDFIGLAWFAVQGLFPMDFLGITWTSTVILPGLLFDAGLFFILIHYGWNLGKIPVVRERTYLIIAGIIFAVVAVAHLLRLFTYGIAITVLGWSVPIWVSWIGIIVAVYLTYMSFRLAMKN